MLLNDLPYKDTKLSKTVSNPLQVNSDKPINTVDFNLLAKNEISMKKDRPKMLQI